MMVMAMILLMMQCAMLGDSASVRDAQARLWDAVPTASGVDAWGPILKKTEGDPQGSPCQGPRSPPESGVKDMEYTAYKFQPSFIEERLKSYKSNLMKFKGHDDLVGNAVRVIRERLESDPRRYLSYGPYWWAIKKVLVDNGVPLGKVDDEKVRLAYTGTTDEETIVMAEEFRNDCLGNMKLYTDRFMLDEESGRWWRLRDPDMAAASAMAAPDIIDYMREF